MAGGVPLELCRFGPEDGRGAVLLVHGASASRDTFVVPDGGLVRYLGQNGFDVWTLDWRGSHRVVERVLAAPADRDEEYPSYTIDQVAELDFPLALRAMRRELGKSKSIAVVAHCFGSGAFAVALARGQAEGVTNVVLSTLGLFYETPWDGWVKAEDYILERVLVQAEDYRAVDPRKLESWPPALAEAYALWRAAWPPDGTSPSDLLLHRLTFMFGAPYAKEVLAPGIHDAGLGGLFGPMHLGLYLHAGQMVRRGYADRFNAPDVIDRARLAKSPTQFGPSRGDLKPEHFADKRLTLLSGAQNRLWHRDSIDLMHEWLLGEVRPKSGGRRARKHVLPNYAHQDLLWGRNAEKDVYGVIRDALSD
jgi:hypothetical protein